MNYKKFFLAIEEAWIRKKTTIRIGTIEISVRDKSQGQGCSCRTMRRNLEKLESIRDLVAAAPDLLEENQFLIKCVRQKMFDLEEKALTHAEWLRLATIVKHEDFNNEPPGR